MKKKKKISFGQIALHLFFIIVSLCYIFPILLVIAVSFEGKNNQYFSLIPKEFSTKAYEVVFKKPQKIITAYEVTIFYSVVATVGNLIVNSMFAYALSKRDFKLGRVFMFLVFFTTLFSGGMVPSYLINSKLLHLNNTIWIYIIPGLFGAWDVIVLRTFFRGLPGELFEAARIDGASEIRIWVQLVVPLSTPALASVGFMGFIGRWNNWSTSQVYIRDPKLYSLQYLLKTLLDSEQTLKQMMQQGMNSLEAAKELQNIESMRFAMAIVVAGPACLLFPFFQKYFARGMILGSVKG